MALLLHTLLNRIANARTSSCYWRNKYRLVALVIFAMIVCGDCEVAVKSGQKFPGVVQFDAIIEIDPPLSPNCVTLFARYWVATNYYCLGILWAEPYGTRIWFPIYPPTLRVASDDYSFSVSSDFFPKNNAMYKKPVGDRGTFVNMFGDYPVSNLRFADEEGYAGRLYLKDLSAFVQGGGSGSKQGIIVSLPDNHAQKRKDCSVKIDSQNEEISSLSLFGGDGQLVKQCEYQYTNAVDLRELVSETTSWPERHTKTGVQEGAVNVKLAQRNLEVKSFESIYEAGGRSSTVEYRPITLGQATVRLPVTITVRRTKDREIIRSVQMTNFHLVKKSETECSQSSQEFSACVPAEQTYRAYTARYWHCDPKEVSTTDVAGIKGLLEELEGIGSYNSNNSLAEELKRVDIEMDLNRIIGDEHQTDALYRAYLSMLATNGLTNMLLDAGYGGIQTALEWIRYEEADHFLTLWVEALIGANDIEAVLKFAAREIPRANPWAIFTVLERFGGDRCPSVQSKFRRSALQCIFLSALRNQINSKGQVKGGLAKAEAVWMAGKISADALENLLDDKLEDAYARLNVSDTPSAS